jgi:hypothetical protein
MTSSCAEGCCQTVGRCVLVSEVFDEEKCPKNLLVGVIIVILSNGRVAAEYET